MFCIMKAALFTPCDAVYDPMLDCAEVDQFGYIDLRQAFLTGTVEGGLAPDDTSYSGIDDPEAILPAPKDQFEAIRQAELANRYGKRKSESPAAPAASPTEGGDASSAAGE